MTDTTVLPETTQPATTARRSLDRWLTMWNGDGALARVLCADDFRITSP